MSLEIDRIKVRHVKVYDSERTMMAKVVHSRQSAPKGWSVRLFQVAK